MRSSMFLVQPTVIDHAYIDDKGRVAGGSFNPNFVISGEVDEKEKVVVDFSSVKKKLKSIIDDRETGFDHKLWVLRNWSNFEISELDEHTYSITTPAVRLITPRNAVKVLDLADSYCPAEIGVELMLHLQGALRQSYPGVNIDVEVHNESRMQLMHMAPRMVEGQVWCADMFTYVHGLKDSTSWGCQNCNHGHLSFVQLFYTIDENLRFVGHQDPRELAREISEYLDGSIFIYEANLVRAQEGNVSSYISIEYTAERGTFKAEYDPTKLKVRVLPTETTVEYLVEHVLEVFGDRLREAGVTRIYLSEGLSKGAMAKL